VSRNAAPDDPVRFAEQVFGVQLWDAQRSILRAIPTERRIAVKAAHASGKSFMAACGAIWFAARHQNARVLTLAPGWLTTRTVLWSEIHSLLQRARLRLPTTVQNQTEIRFGPDNLILGLSSNESARLQGHHAEHVLLIADESPGISEDLWPAIEGILASGDSHLLLLGNPTVNAGYFYDAFGRNCAAWSTFTISAFATPNLGGMSLERLLKLSDDELDENPTPYLTNRRWVRERYAEWWNGSPENSPLWQSRVLGEFQSSSSNALIPLAWLEHARQPAFDNGGDINIGVDVAGPGKDRTVAVACRGGAIIDVGIYTDADARGVTLNFIRKYQDRLRMIRIDSAGAGWYFLQDIRDAGYRAAGVNVGSGPDERERERFRNLKAQRYWFLRERFERGEISGLSDEMLAELSAVKYLINARGHVEIEDKASVKSLIGRSPDLAEALMIAIGEHEPQRFEYRPAPPIPGSMAAFRPGAPGPAYATKAQMDAAEDAEEARAKAFKRRWSRFNQRACW
jgi:phage terminase large subunit